MTLYLLPPCEQDDNEPDIDCLVCEDRGEFRPSGSDVLMPCPECERGGWDYWHELLDDMRRGK